MPQDSRSYTTIDVAKRLGVSLQTVQRWVDAGHLKAWKTLGGHRRIEATSAELLFKAQEAQIGAFTESASQPQRRSAPLSVLVVDDDPIDRELLVMLVHKALPEANVDAAADGFNGLVAIGKIAPDIVVTDIHMPHMDGFEMIRHLLADGSTRPRVIFAVSARTRQELAEMGELPAEVLLFTKPLDADSFVAALLEAWRQAPPPHAA